MQKYRDKENVKKETWTGGSVYNPRHAKECLEPPEAGRGKEGVFS